MIYLQNQIKESNIYRIHSDLLDYKYSYHNLERIPVAQLPIQGFQNYFYLFALYSNFTK